MKRFILHRDAEAEWRDAADFYEACLPGLGRSFVEKTTEAFDRITDAPEIYPHYKKTRARKCPVARFPCLIFFVELPDAIWITAIAHAKRDENYWMNRWSDEP
jgi:plasmid stabilization system protein ParE